MSALAEHRRQAQLDVFHAYADTLLAWLERRPADMRTKVAALEGLKIMNDPEAMFQEGWLLCDVGEHAEGMKLLRRAIDKGYTVATTLAESPAFDALRGDAVFQQLLADAESGPTAGPCGLPRERRRAAARALTPRSLGAELAQVVVRVQVSPAQPRGLAHRPEDRVRQRQAPRFCDHQPHQQLDLGEVGREVGRRRRDHAEPGRAPATW